MPLMIGLALVENLRRVSYRIAWRRQHRSWALEWSQRFIQIIQKEPKSLITVLADFVHSNPPTAAPFLAELTADLQGRHPSLGLVINWIEQELAERGQTLELLQQAESHDQAADQVSIGNSITSLRKLSTIDWKNFVELLSIVEAVLRKDPLIFMLKWISIPVIFAAIRLKNLPSLAALKKRPLLKRRSIWLRRKSHARCRTSSEDSQLFSHR